MGGGGCNGYVLETWRYICLENMEINILRERCDGDYNDT